MKVKLNLLLLIDPPYSVNMHHATSTWFQCNRKLQAHTMSMCVCVSASVFVCQKGCQTTCLMYRHMPHIRLAKKGWKIPIMKQRTMRMHNKHTRTSRAAKCGQSNWQTKKKNKNKWKGNKKERRHKDGETNTTNKRKTKLVSCQRAEEAKGCVAPYLISGNFFLEQTLDQNARDNAWASFELSQANLLTDRQPVQGINRHSFSAVNCQLKIG